MRADIPPVVLSQAESPIDPIRSMGESTMLLVRNVSQLIRSTCVIEKRLTFIYVLLLSTRMYSLACSRSAESASESVRIRDGSEALVGHNPLFICRVVPHPCRRRPAPHSWVTEGSEGHGGAEPCSPRARPASSSRGVSWEARGPERSHRSGGLLGPAQVLCRLTPAGPRRGALLASEEC